MLLPVPYGPLQQRFFILPRQLGRRLLAKKVQGLPQRLTDLLAAQGRGMILFG